MNKKIIFTFLLIFTLCLSLGAVFADDANMEMNTASSMDDSTEILNSIDDGDVLNHLDESSVVDEDTVVQEESPFLGDANDGEGISSVYEDVLSDGDGTSFKDLSAKINSVTDVLDLTDDYIFNNLTDGNFINGIPINKKDLIINGNNHFIDGNGQSSIFRLFDTGLIINNLTFRNSNGSAIFANYSDISTNNVIFSDCLAVNGSAVCGYYTFYESLNDRFINNYAKQGAAIFLDEDSELKLVNGSFVSEKELHYGLIYLSSSKMSILNTTFLNLTSTYSPAIFGTNILGEIKNCRFMNLYANITGGAIAFKDIQNDIVIDNCSFINISSKRNGGAIFRDVANCGYDCSHERGICVV